MGTHPIFESDFDCLTAKERRPEKKRNFLKQRSMEQYPCNCRDREHSQICIQNKLDRDFRQCVAALKVTRTPLKKLIGDLSTKSEKNKATLHRLRHLYSIISGKNQWSTQLSFVREHTPFLMSLASLRTPNMKLSVERERRLEIKKE